MILLKLPLPQIIAHPSTYIKTTEYKKGGETMLELPP